MVLTVTEDTPADMLAGSMELLVQLPRDHHVHSQRVTVERSTAMMDLLVQIATAHKLAASSYTLQAIGERGVVLPHQPNTPIGALDALQVKLLPKQGTFIPRKAKQPNQPFETTFRLQVHLPRNQLYVSRVSPKMNLGEILEEVCREKNLDRNKYELRHPGNHEEILDPSLSLQDYHLQEVTLYARQGRMLGSALSSQDIMALQRQEDRRRQQAKQSVFGFMFRKSKESSLSTDSLGRSVSPAHSDETARSVSPLAPPTRPQRKRRPAPSPPVQTTQNNNIEMSKNHKEKLIINHSRNSSDSSGYHEASVLSDNPDSAMMPETLPRRSKAPGKFEARRLAHTAHASKSLSNLAMTASLSHATSNSSLSSTGIRKKRAAPPPPISRPLSSAISTQALERIVDSEESLTSDMGISKPPSDIGTNSKANSDIAVGIHTPESPPEDFYQLKPSKKSVEMMTEGSQDRKSHVIEQIEHIVEPARVAKRVDESRPIPKPRKAPPQVVDHKLHPVESPVSSDKVEIPVETLDLPPTGSHLYKNISSNFPQNSSKILEKTSENSAENSNFPPKEEQPKLPEIVPELSPEIIKKIPIVESPSEHSKVDPEPKEPKGNNETSKAEEVGEIEEIEEIVLKVLEDSIKGEMDLDSLDGSSTISGRSCEVISTIPKCCHLTSPTSDESLNSPKNTDTLATNEDMEKLERATRKCKTRIFRSQSALGNFEGKFFERSRPTNSHPDNFNCALNQNISAEIIAGINNNGCVNSGGENVEKIDGNDTPKSQQYGHAVVVEGMGKADFEEVPSSTDILLQKVSTTLATVVPSSDAHDSPPTPPTEPSITSPEPSAPSSANQTLNSQQDTSDYVSATGEELSTTDWEYQLPDPPSAFRDTESPTFGYDTITLASVDAFKEPIALIDPAESSMDHRDPQSPLESPVAPTDHPKDLQQSPESHKKPEIPSLNCKESQIPLTSEDPKKSQLSGISENPTSRITMSPENPIKNQKSLITENPIKPETLPLSEKPIKLSPEVETSPVELKKHIITELESKIENGSLKFDDSKKIFNKSSPRIAPVDNTLSNFTITTYSNQKPSIWSETSDQIFPDASDERIVKTFATLSRNRSGFPKEAAHISKRDKGAIEESRVRRAQSFQDVERQEEGKLRDARESEKEALDVVLRPQKMNNDGKSSVVHRSKSYIVLSNNSKYREAKTLDIPDTPMYKSTSYTNLNQEREELQSLQVLKSILPQLKKSSLENTPEKSSEKFQPPPDSPKPHEKRYKWAGPPAISLGSWSERPSVNVQIKHDSDYKFGATPSKSNQSGGKTVVNLNSTSNDVEIINYENSRPTRSITHTKIGSKTESRTNFLEKLAAVEKSRIFETPKIDEIDKCIEKSSKSNDSDDVKIDRRPVNFRELTQAFGQVNFRSKSRPNQQSIQNRHSDYFEYRSESDNARQENYQNNWSKGKRYTSVVGINPHGVVQGNGFRNEPKVNGPKVNGFLPVVKGFKVQVKETVKSDNVGDRVPPPPPPTMPVITGVTLKSANVRAKPVVLGMEPRDQLLESIRNFGRDRLRSVS